MAELWTKVFVYGTLKKHGRANGKLKDGNLVQYARVRGYLFSVDNRFPALVYDEGSEDMVQGEIWEVPVKALDNLDNYEGEGTLYKRVCIPTSHGYAWTYIMEAARIRREAYQVITDGFWPTYVTDKGIVGPPSGLRLTPYRQFFLTAVGLPEPVQINAKGKEYNNSYEFTEVQPPYQYPRHGDVVYAVPAVVPNKEHRTMWKAEAA